MPQPFKWLYYLLRSDGKSYNYTNTLVVNNTAKPIENTPDGWQDKLVNFGRNSKYFGIFRSFTIPLKFVTEGKKVLRHLVLNSGIEEVCNLSIHKLNNAWLYDPYYEGELDFSKFKNEDDYATCNVMEAGISKLLKANEGTAQEIPVIGEHIIPVYMGGILFRSTIDYVLPEGNITTEEYTLGLQVGNQEGTSRGVLVGSSPLQDLSGFEDPSTNEDRFILASTEDVVEFNYKAKHMFSVLAGDVNYREFFLNSSGVAIDIIPLTTLIPGDYTFDIDITFTLAKDEKMFIRVSRSTGGAVYYYTSYPKITFFSKALPTTIPSFTWAHVYKELTKKVTDNTFTGESNLLDSRTDLVITSSDAIRNLTGAVIKTNFNDLFKAAYSVLNVGLGFENNKAKLEELEYFFDNTLEISNLGNASDLKLSVAEDLIFNTIKVGYQNQTYDSLNGKDEFNSTQIYKSPITRIVKEWDLICPYRADSIGLELVRANLTDQKTTDSDSDNDVFILQIEPFQLGEDAVIDVTFAGTGIGSGTLDLTALTPNNIVPGVKITFAGSTLNTGTYTITGLTSTFTHTFISVKEPTVSETGTFTVKFFGNRPKKGPYDITPTGLISPLSVFNVELSPKRNLLNHLNYLNSIYYKLDTKDITFQSALKNAELVASIGGVSVSEKSNVTIGTTPRLFLPFYFTFDCQVPIDLVDLMKTKSNGYFSFNWQGHTYKGFPIDISIKPADNDIQEFKLLACPDNVLTNLI